MGKRMKTLFVLLMLLCLTACGGSDFQDTAVLKIDEQEVMKSEYMVYLYTTSQSFEAAAGEDVWNMDFDGQTADELVEERTISTLQSVIAAKDYAEANGISLTAEEKEQAKLAAEQFTANVPAEDLAKMGVDTEEVIPLMENSYLYTLVYQAIASECQVDPSETEEYYQENKEDLKKDYTLLTLQSVLLADAETAAEVAEKAKSGEDFAALFAAYDIDPSAENGGEMTLYQSRLRAGFGVEEELEKGEIAGPLRVGEGYIVLKVSAKDVPGEETVKELAENVYTSEVQTAYTEARFAEMMKLQSVEKIASEWEALEKFH